jgi:hypothetical protein
MTAPTVSNITLVASQACAVGLAFETVLQGCFAMCAVKSCVCVVIRVVPALAVLLQECRSSLCALPKRQLPTSIICLAALSPRVCMQVAHRSDTREVDSKRVWHRRSI